MSRRDVSPGFGARIERVRNRVRIPPRAANAKARKVPSRAAFAKVFDISSSTYKNWVDEDASTGAVTLKRGLVRLGVWGVDRLLSWLADGEGFPPAWLEDEEIDPQGPEPSGELTPENVIAFPRAALDFFQEATGAMDKACAAGELRTPLTIQAFTALQRAKSLRWDSDPRPHHYENGRWKAKILPSIQGPRKAS